MQCTFGSEKRVKHKKEFQKIFQDSFRIYGNYFVFHVLLCKNDCPKLGVVVSKKFGHAVYRNTIKRIVREEFRKSKMTDQMSVVVCRSRGSCSKIQAYKELKKCFALLSDKYLLSQYAIDKTRISLKYAYPTQKISLISKIGFYLILMYKKYLSPCLPNSCRMVPTCSIYALDALRIHPFLRAMYLVLKRFLHCCPLGTRERFDPIMKNKVK